MMLDCNLPINQFSLYQKDYFKLFHGLKQTFKIY